MQMVVETRSGRVRGRDLGGVRGFLGVPYARAPEQEARYRAPQPPLAWVGERPAEDFGPPAPQAERGVGPVPVLDASLAREDCLSVNVWTPDPAAGPYPVMVWIHGGAFTIGSSLQPIYDGAWLARLGVVVVSLNYRLGALGFVHLGELAADRFEVEENLGLRDQLAALEWVRDNIEAFGGDPTEVTVFGESAGAMSVASLLAMPRARGLFRRAILQSGAANFASPRAQATQVAERFLHELALKPDDLPKLWELPWQELVAAQVRVSQALISRVTGLPFQPVIDGDLLPRPLLTAVSEGAAQGVELILGTNLDEMRLFGFADPEAFSLDDAALRRRVAWRLPGGDEAADRLIEVYRRARLQRGEGVTPSELWFAIDSDRTFRVPAMTLAAAQTRQSANVYAYLFTWASPFLGGQLGACHALEIPFVFGTFRQPMMAAFVGDGPAAEDLSRTMMAAWVRFAGGAAPEGEAWLPYEEGSRWTRILGSEGSGEFAPREEERRVWDEIPGAA